jgi:hypothetical protein
MVRSQIFENTQLFDSSSAKYGEPLISLHYQVLNLGQMVPADLQRLKMNKNL